ncbi:sensor histidine kinase [Flavobacterium psychrotrophum]|uniref:sensor histidine kinase n=1 Tax=Flavobacterium psychrotrophum TaxID=2294119 RepID=UPI000E31F2B9|nr:ATP-binding protein [Flavobacterium psychrotrophum]
MEDQKESTQNSRQNQETYQRMIAEVQDYAILLLDTEGNVQNWNLGAQQIKGYSEQEIVGRNFRIFYLDADREALLPEKLISEAFAVGRATHEGWRVRKDGSTFWGLVVITAVHDAEGNTIGFTKVTRDLTERKLAEDQIRNYAKDIEFRNKQLEEFAYIASHDLQEPLRKIQIFAEMLHSNLDDKDSATRYAEKITASAQRMSNLIKSVLKYSQLSRTDDLYERVDLNTVLGNVKEDYDLLIKEKNVTLTAVGMPVINAIPVQMHQLLGNLLSNAIKFASHEPDIKITSRPVLRSELDDITISDKSRAYIQIVVADNGIGFEQHYAEQVFKIFKRLTDNAGTGIGLALCKKIVENHHGHISVASELGKGTVFTILLPE